MAILEDVGLTSLSGSFGWVSSELFIWIFWATIIGGLIGTAIILLRNYLIYKYGVTLLTKRGEHFTVSKTLPARLFVIDDGTKRLSVPFLKKKFTIPNSDYIYASSDKRFKEGMIYLLKIDEETFTPVKLDMRTRDRTGNAIPLVPLASDLNAFRQLHIDLKKTFDTKNFWNQHGALIIQMAGLGMILGCMVIIVVMMADNFQAFAGASDSLRTAVESMNHCTVSPTIGG